MAKVEARKGERPEDLLKRFRRIVSKEGVLKELKQRARYEKPSQKRRRQEKERMKSVRKAERKRKEPYVRPKEEDKRRVRNRD